MMYEFGTLFRVVSSCRNYRAYPLQPYNTIKLTKGKIAIFIRTIRAGSKPNQQIQILLSAHGDLFAVGGDASEKSFRYHNLEAI